MVNFENTCYENLVVGQELKFSGSRTSYKINQKGIYIGIFTSQLDFLSSTVTTNKARYDPRYTMCMLRIRPYHLAPPYTRSIRKVVEKKAAQIFNKFKFSKSDKFFLQQFKLCSQLYNGGGDKSSMYYFRQKRSCNYCMQSDPSYFVCINRHRAIDHRGDPRREYPSTFSLPRLGVSSFPVSSSLSLLL